MRTRSGVADMIESSRTTISLTLCYAADILRVKLAKTFQLLVRLDCTSAVWRISRHISSSNASRDAVLLAVARMCRREGPDARQSRHHLHPESGATPQKLHSKPAIKPSLRTGKQHPTCPGDRERHISCRTSRLLSRRTLYIGR